jgi:predicted DNA-binding transcriptional regulator AlpA
LTEALVSDTLNAPPGARIEAAFDEAEAALAAGPDPRCLPTLIGRAAALLARLQVALLGSAAPGGAVSLKDDPDRILSVEEASELLNISREAAWRWGGNGRIPGYVKAGEKSAGFRQATLRKWIQTKERASAKSVLPGTGEVA